MLPRNKKAVLRFKQRGTRLVEQTTRGHRHLETEEGQRMLELLNVPAVSIAVANTKRNLESPFIGIAVAKETVESLRKAQRLSDLGKVFVLGFGNVGEATVLALSRLKLAESIDVYDVKENDLKKKIQDLNAHPLKSFPDNGEYNTVFGCTGKDSVHNTKQLGILAENAVLVSGSSAAVEFNREKFIDLAYKNERDDFYVVEPERTRRQGIHAKITIHMNEKEFSFLNAGFPVNFDGSIECVPNLLIQPTHGMLIAAAYQTLSQKAPGMNLLGNKYDEWFYTNGLKWVKRYADGAAAI